MSKKVYPNCWRCQYCENIGRQQSQRGQLGRKRYYCNHPRVKELKDRHRHPLNPFVGYGDMTLNSPLTLKTRKRWCPLLKTEGDEP